MHAVMKEQPNISLPGPGTCQKLDVVVLDFEYLAYENVREIHQTSQPRFQV